MNRLQLGQIVWHDLLTPDITVAMDFYAKLLGWEYHIEHAVNCVWHPGEADYPLIMANATAHGGLVEVRPETPSHWLAYVEVADVDAAVAQAQTLGSTIERTPFNIPGVGRSAVIRDPQGAVVCLTISTHHFSPPRGTFLQEVLLTADVEAAQSFYQSLFGWQIRDIGANPFGLATQFVSPEGSAIAGVLEYSSGVFHGAVWVPCLATTDSEMTLTQAQTLGASPYPHGSYLCQQAPTLLADPTGAVFGLLSLSSSNPP